ncbi:TPA: hypothetical protein DIC20_01115 [Candidatus Dependentiae bacterium]|nr:MAG: hypothetical protein US03_C0002G0168 [candidate division TM6 bacterium GW2011_GWF2_36_131]KKQ03601.1 MAG: hypothetical protein US13_C0002G0167 [candidate division TM6 bacterium GW2011_GWE2_36_25]KKQ20122.1 MAG: hypothetical protein US32_C0001G0019 [candidate division TM6 bacterium GW2011_GWA2_36_9]HBR70665.1 hypothetical protein [Candidatus Dependentiae bacterium]HCU00285.1 hypothetical protein [Candidatus Dependentiae bacterium]
MKIYTLLLFFLVNLLESTIFEIETIKQVKDLGDHETLVLFDIDHTILQSIFSSRPRKTQYITNLIDFFFTNILTNFILESAILPFLSNIRQFIPEKVTEPEFISLIHSLQKKNIPTLALTKRLAIPGDITAQQLKKIDIDFSVPPFTQKTIDLTPPAQFTEGIILTGGKNKGSVLSEFLKKTKRNFKKITLIDDKLKNLQDVNEATKKLNINFTGIRYGYLDNKEQLCRFLKLL